MFVITENIMKHPVKFYYVYLTPQQHDGIKDTFIMQFQSLGG